MAFVLLHVSLRGGTSGRRWRGIIASQAEGEVEDASPPPTAPSGQVHGFCDSSDRASLPSQRSRRTLPVGLKRGGIKYGSASSESFTPTDNAPVSKVRCKTVPTLTITRYDSFETGPEVLSLSPSPRIEPSPPQLKSPPSCAAEHADDGAVKSHCANPAIRFSLIIECKRVVPTALAV